MHAFSVPVRQELIHRAEDLQAFLERFEQKDQRLDATVLFELAGISLLFDMLFKFLEHDVDEGGDSLLNSELLHVFDSHGLARDDLEQLVDELIAVHDRVAKQLLSGLEDENLDLVSSFVQKNRQHLTDLG